MHVRLNGHLKCNFLLAQACPRMMQHLLVCNISLSSACLCNELEDRKHSNFVVALMTDDCWLPVSSTIHTNWDTRGLLGLNVTALAVCNGMADEVFHIRLQMQEYEVCSSVV